MKQVLLIDDHKIVTGAIGMMLQGYFHGIAVFKAESFPGALEILSTQHELDMIVLDIDIPGGKEQYMIADIRKTHPRIPILILSGYEEEIYALRFLTAGANGFISKDSSEDDILKAIVTVFNEGKYVSSSIQKKIVQNFFDGKYETKSSNHYRDILTPRENDVLELLLKGRWTKEIARELRINLSTVSSHKTRIFEKFDVDNSIDLFKKIENYRKLVPGQ
jgi:two-component system, NarL family, invasion response regulator UvrY